ncbi:GAF and ANTAR domain-containing protein [Amycolatopsis australiensis]|uniref:ANTAR domain-containing protein n=1 Tax=Amycolatopsis australiensis TaxID=546364 RepID=A0A1K1SSB0_9PSEU|nr:GAF and ANTAR domain-containing protein [Amycolatopsis australiensis]SFW86975.1 ANTAR domain-containing protein [Amycolatopsis australiensis]
MDQLHEVTAALLELTSTLKPEDSRERLLGRVAARVVGIIPGADAATVTLYDRDVPSTVAATEPAVQALDEAQYRADDGPCLRAVRTETVVRTQLGRNRHRWPELADAGTALGIRSSLSCPLFVAADDAATHRRAAEYGLGGALNVWSRRDDAFDPVATATIAVFTSAAAAVVLTAARWASAEAQARGLVTALESRDTIATAKGIVMARAGLDRDAAFAWLVDVSQRTNRKVRELATVIVEAPEVVERALL